MVGVGEWELRRYSGDCYITNIFRCVGGGFTLNTFFFFSKQPACGQGPNHGGNEKNQLLIPCSLDKVQAGGNQAFARVLDPSFTIHPFCGGANPWGHQSSIAEHLRIRREKKKPWYQEGEVLSIRKACVGGKGEVTVERAK